MHENDNADVVPSLLTGEGSRRNFMSNAAKLGGSALALSALGSGAVAAGQDDDEGEAESASVTFENQSTDGSSVTVASATLPEGGFVAIHDARLLEGDALGSVVGVSELLDAGEHEDVEVTLFGDVPGAEFEQSALEETQPLIPMPHLNTNDNESYDFISSEGADDGPYTNAGAAVVGLGFAVIEGEMTTEETTTA